MIARLAIVLVAGFLAVSAQAQTLLLPVAPGMPATIAPAPQAPQPNADDRPLALDARPLMLGGALKTPQLWQAYKTRFVTEAGRVIDTGNGLVSHSEGQGYAMVLAVAANDRQAFDLIWGWTRANLMVRDDQLIA